MCVHRHDLQVPKRDSHLPEYVPTLHDIEAMMTTKAFCSLLRHGDIERLPGEERKSLSSFNVSDSGWILPSQMVDGVLSCLVDQTNVASLMEATISASSIVFSVDNVDFSDSVGWACEVDFAVNRPAPGLGSLEQLEIKCEVMGARVCAGSATLADARFNVEAWAINKATRGHGEDHRRDHLRQRRRNAGGILNPPSGVRHCETAASTATAGSKDCRDLVALRFGLSEQYQARASFFDERPDVALAHDNTDVVARPILLPTPLRSDGRTCSGYTIAGSPIHIVSQMRDVQLGSHFPWNSTMSRERNTQS
jgi:HK97 family phage major capsid protein